MQELVDLDPKSAEIIRPILRGRDVKKYACENTDIFLINTLPSLKIDIERYPAVKQHLLSFGFDKLKQTGEIGSRKKTNNKWYETQDSISYWDDFSKQKIIYPNMTKFMPFYHDNDGFLINQKCFMITGKHLEYLTAFFNSFLFKFCFQNNFPELQGNTKELSKVFFEQIPVAEISDSMNDIFKIKVQQIQAKKKSNQSVDEEYKEIEMIISDLYHLTAEEQKCIMSIKSDSFF